MKIDISRILLFVFIILFSWQVTGTSVVTIKLRKDSVFSLVVDPSNPSTIYVGTMHGICKSVDGGNHWMDMNQGLVDTCIWLLCLDPQNPSIIYACSGEYLYKSNDGGKNWAPINTGLTNSHVRSLAIKPSNPSILYAGTGDGVFKSINAGSSWTAVLSGGSIRNIAIDSGNNSIIYAIRDGIAILKSGNGGESWSAPSYVNNAIITMVIDPSHPMS